MSTLRDPKGVQQETIFDKHQKEGICGPVSQFLMVYPGRKAADLGVVLRSVIGNGLRSSCLPSVRGGSHLRRRAWKPKLQLVF